MDERELIIKAKSGDVPSFELLVAKYQKQLYNHAYRVMNNADDAMDMTQEALVKAYLNISSFRLDSQFSTWLFRIVHNACLDELRKKKRVTMISDEVLAENVSTEPSPEAVAEQNDMRITIAKAMNKLSDSHRQAILLRDVNGFSYEEIASITGTAVGTVKSRINRARQELKEMLFDFYGTKSAPLQSNKVKGGEIGEL